MAIRVAGPVQPLAELHWKRCWTSTVVGAVDRSVGAKPHISRARVEADAVLRGWVLPCMGIICLWQPYHLQWTRLAWLIS